MPRRKEPASNPCGPTQPAEMPAGAVPLKVEVEIQPNVIVCSAGWYSVYKKFLEKWTDRGDMK